MGSNSSNSSRPQTTRRKKFSYVDSFTLPEFETMKKFPFERFAKGIGLNENEFMIVSNSIGHNKQDGVFIYNFHQKRLFPKVLYGDYGLGFVDNPNAALNKDTNQLFIHCGVFSQHQLVIIDLNQTTSASNPPAAIASKSQQKKPSVAIQIVSNPLEIGYDAECLIVNGIFHIIGGWASNKHFRWNENQKKLEEMHCFQQFNGQGFGHFGLIHLKSRQQILLLGGKSRDHISREVYSFCTIQNRWSRLDIELPEDLYSFSVVACQHDRFVVLIGGIQGSNEYNHSNSRKIIILDMRQQSFYNSQIQCPFEGRCKAITTSNYAETELLIAGAIRYLCDLLSFPGQDIIDLIVAMYGLKEFLHLIGHEFHEGGLHRMIDLELIIRFSGKNWIISAAMKSKCDSVFYERLDLDQQGYASEHSVTTIIMDSGLSQRVAKQIWDLADRDQDGRMNQDEFAIAMFLVGKVKQREELPASLPQELILPSKYVHEQ